MKDISRNEITNSQREKRFQQIDQTLYTFYDGTKYQDKKVCLSTRHVIGLKHQFKIDQVAIEDK